ncbi:hypothetical protein C0Q44_03005 [Paenibacillus sp. PCH8]|uniref:hypothetical protein n=1 Tax=Paenibacillus sp. PCH8 TaxID=2066524 RepID=UPI000CF88730|nr:hypothetical protein [Paenibacillus sp. PCH8]PQP83674.1 hypothetical protein C0Q44_03005 [Paenibacillus sp. PCH8]
MVIKATPITLEQLKRKEIEAAQSDANVLGEAREVSARAVSARAVEARAVSARAVEARAVSARAVAAARA